MADQTPLDLTIQARATEAATAMRHWHTHGGTAGVTYVAAPAENVPALLAEIIALRTRIAGYESALNFQTTCTGCADYLDQLLDRDVEIQRLSALVGEEGQPGWDNIDRAEAIRQAEESHADRLQWIQRFDALRDQRDAEVCFDAMAPIIEQAVRAEVVVELRTECRRMLSIPDDIPPFASMLVNHPRRNGKTVAAGLENAARLIETTRLVARDRGDHG